MTANVLARIFTIEIGGKPTLTFEALNIRGAHQLCHEQWLKDDLEEAKSDGVVGWKGQAAGTVRASRRKRRFCRGQKQRSNV